MPLLTAPELLDLLESNVDSEKKIGIAVGAYPLIHAGTVRFLRDARAQCDVLIALVFPGETAGLKQFLRVEERQQILSGFQEVEAAAIVSSSNLEECKKVAPEAVWMVAASEVQFPEEIAVARELARLEIRVKRVHPDEFCTSAEVLTRMAKPAEA